MKDRLTGGIVGAACAAVIVLASVGFGFFLGERVGARSALVEAISSIDEAGAPTATPDAEAGGSISIPGFEQVTFEAGETVQEIYLYNPAQNACYFVISLFLPDRAVIYRSGLLPPGKELNSIELLRPLEVGTYEGAFIRYACLSLENMEPLNGAEMNFTLEVK